jgi:putative FmdB family regulatory protein
MPIREYKCNKCGNVSELIVGIGRNSDDVACSHCGGNDLEALMSASSFAIKGEAAPAPMGSCCGSNP